MVVISVLADLQCIELLNIKKIGNYASQPIFNTHVDFIPKKKPTAILIKDSISD